MCIFKKVLKNKLLRMCELILQEHTNEIIKNVHITRVVGCDEKCH